ncbi:Gpi transamidase subunit pig-u family protein, partial [Globisporangium splendens]
MIVCYTSTSEAQNTYLELRDDCVRLAAGGIAARVAIYALPAPQQTAPVSSVKRVAEGAFLFDHVGSPYAGDVFHQPPLVFALFYPIFGLLKTPNELQFAALFKFWCNDQEARHESMERSSIDDNALYSCKSAASTSAERPNAESIRPGIAEINLPPTANSSRTNMKDLFAIAAAAVALVNGVAAEDGAGVTIVDQSKNLTATGGTGNLAAAGSLEPFGGIGIGCGVNWEENGTFGGGLQAGSSSFGLGGGYTVSSDKLTMGMGIGVTSIYNASVQLDVTTKGSVSFVFSSSGAFTCENTVVDGNNAIKCTSS